MTTPTDQPTIRLLTREDGPLYQKLRLLSLQEQPQVFLSTYDTEEKLHEERFSDHLDWAYHPPHFGYFGLFVKDELVGYIQTSKSFLEKQSHVAFMSNLYLIPQVRGQGLAQYLLDHIFKLLKSSEHIERLYLTCIASNKPAIQLYQKLGFTKCGTKSKAIKWHGHYDDELEFEKVL
jgi:RimJ/RimL family protein N-acetyltransferase